MWFSKVDHRFLENMFEETLLGGTDLVELIDVDKREAIEVKLGILLS